MGSGPVTTKVHGRLSARGRPVSQFGYLSLQDSHQELRGEDASLIDCHTHIMLTDTDDSHYDDILLKQSWQYRTILATLNVKRDLEAGFTAMRDVETEGAMYRSL